MRFTFDLTTFERLYRYRSIKDIQKPLKELKNGCEFECRFTVIKNKKKKIVDATVMIVGDQAYNDVNNILECY